MKHLVLLDGHHLLYRAYWAIPRTLMMSTGEQVNTVFGMAAMLLPILQQEQPDALLFCFDEGDETLRHQEHETYKDGRAETPSDFYPQVPRAFDMIEAFGLPTVSDSKYEADDFLGAYALAAVKAGFRVTIVTGDRDLFQLASEHIRISIPHKGYQEAEYLGPTEVLTKMGVTPAQIPAYKGLCGDASDNLPGVRGIGPKTAVQLIQTYGSLEGIYDHLEDIRPTVRRKLEADREQAFFCQRMAQLMTDIALPIPLAKLHIEKLPTAKIVEAFNAFEFTLLSRRLQKVLETDYGRLHFEPLSDAMRAEVTPADSKRQLSLFQTDKR